MFKYCKSRQKKKKKNYQNENQKTKRQTQRKDATYTQFLVYNITKLLKQTGAYTILP